nr:hypothetical protein [Tanacetum cinerariifolium]
MLVHQGKGSGTPTEPHHTPSPEAQTPSYTTHPTSSLLPVTTTSTPTVTPTETTPIRHYTRRTRIAQSSVPSTIADELASPQRYVSQREAYPTDSGFIADQDRTTIAKSSTLPYDSAPRVTSPAAEVEINQLKEKVKLLEEREGAAAINFGDDAPIKGKSIDEGEAVVERVSDDTEEMATVLTSMDAATVLASGVVNVSTGSGSIPTASTPAEGSVPTGSEEVPTASLVFAIATVIDAQIVRELKEQLEREDQRRSEQIARDEEIARTHAEEELQIMIDGLDRSNEKKPKTKKQKRDFYMAVIINNLGWKVKDFKGMSFEEVEAKFKTVWEQIKEVPEKVKSSDEVPEEKIKEMMQLVPIEEVYVEALQVKHPIIDWEVHTEGQRAYWKITRLGGSSASYQFFTDLLKHLNRDDLNQLWSLVKETLSKRPATSDKEMELWVELSRLYEPNVED